VVGNRAGIVDAEVVVMDSIDRGDLASVTGGTWQDVAAATGRVAKTMGTDAQNGGAVGAVAGAVVGGVAGGVTGASAGGVGAIPGAAVGAFTGGRTGMVIGTIGGGAWGLGQGIVNEIRR
jgi:hypothetical protein